MPIMITIFESWVEDIWGFENGVFVALYSWKKKEEKIFVVANVNHFWEHIFEFFSFLILISVILHSK